MFSYLLLLGYVFLPSSCHVEEHHISSAIALHYTSSDEPNLVFILISGRLDGSPFAIGSRSFIHAHGKLLSPQVCGEAPATAH